MEASSGTQGDDRQSTKKTEVPYQTGQPMPDLRPIEGIHAQVPDVQNLFQKPCKSRQDPRNHEVQLVGRMV